MQIVSVVPYIGTWIETIGAGRRQKRAIGRTLYRYVDWNNTIRMSFVTPLSRTLYRYVDWNTDVDTIKIQGLVVPYIGTWIETGLYVSVIKRGAVVPYIGTWIETIVAGEDDPEKWSYLI